MSELDVRIVKLEPMRVASFHAFGSGPEHKAARKLIDWAKPRELLDTPEKHRIFGFDNPSPSPGSPNYGYEFWISIGSDVEPEDGVTIKEFSGGLYAVVRCEVKENANEIIPTAWKRLVAWREGSSKYECATNECLEEYIGPLPFIVTDTSGIFSTIIYTVHRYLMTASNLHASRHWPHFMHLPWSMTCSSFWVPSMASTGQTFLHTPHPVQVSMIR